jgi:hypothetical protein
MVTKKVAKQRQKSKSQVVENTPAEKHWFPEDAKAATAATTPAKKTSPWQRRAAPISYGTLAKPGFSIREEFNTHCSENHKKLSDPQLEQLWKVVGSEMLNKERHKLAEVIDSAIKHSK